MNKNLALSEEYENNPGLDIQKLKTQLELMINKSLLVTELILLIIAICSTLAISLTPDAEKAFEVMVTVCFSVNLLILLFLLYAGFSSIRTLRSIYNNEFSECVVKVGIILTVFMICFLVKAGFGVVYLSSIFEKQNTQPEKKDKLMFILFPFIWELFPIMTVYYLYKLTL